MQRAEDEVTGHGRANRDICRFDVANFANHHDVRVLSQNVTQTFGERKIDLWFYVNLWHARDSILDRFFDGDDATLHRINATQEAIQRCRFSAAGRPGEQNDSVSMREQIANDLFLFLAQIEAIEVELLSTAAEQS